MSLRVGTQLGSLEITALLGKGGMGEVYRARDTKLKREVAIKILPEEFSRDPDRVNRFQREAEVLASLNHPNIAAIYDLEEAGDSRYLVLELVEGETLADRLKHGAIPIEETLSIAKSICEAFEAAHEKGIVHRDLKPANTKITHEGKVKILDFGLAKALAPSTSADLSNSPTMMSGTAGGVILGTAAYMSPEQARGRPLDKRTDIWAFGCVLYEMLTGRKTFERETVSDTIVAILDREPDWSALPETTPLTIRRLLQRCLEKDPKRRLRDMGDVGIQIEDALQQPPNPVPRALRRARLALWQIALVFAAVVVAIVVARYWRAPVDMLETRLDVTTRDSLSFALSPDGRRLAFVAVADGQPMLHLRQLESAIARQLAGTEGARYPFWSPNSRSIGFFADGKLKRVDIDGTPSQIIAVAIPGLGGTWGVDDTIIFAPDTYGRLFRVPASGGKPSEVTTLEAPRQTAHIFPQFLPGGRRFLFYVRGEEEVQGIYVGSLEDQRVTRVTSADTPGLYASPGWLLFIRQRTLLAQRFDPMGETVNGEPLHVADSVAVRTGPLALGAFSVSEAGSIAYRTGESAQTQLRWFDRSGKMLDSVGQMESGLFDPVLSRDGRHVAFGKERGGGADVWVTEDAQINRFTIEGGGLPIWSPDGRHIVFGTDRNGSRSLFQKPASGGTEIALLQSPTVKMLNDWSPDGRFILYTELDREKGTDLWVLPLEGDRKPFSFLNTRFSETWGQFSPDGHWVAYQSNEAGQRNEIYLRPFPGREGQWQVSIAGGVYPRWAPDGKELYYFAPDGQLMAAAIAVRGSTLEIGARTPLFQPRVVGGGTSIVGHRQQYAVAPDGRFLVNVDTSSELPITLIMNWKPKP